MLNKKTVDTFLKTVELGSMNKAAAILHYAPQSVKSILDALERDLGCPLIARSRTGVVLTEAGEVLYEEGPALLQMIQHIEDRIKASNLTADHDMTGCVKVLTPYNQRYEQLEKYANRFGQAYPNVCVSYVPRASISMEESVKLVVEGVADVGTYPQEGAEKATSLGLHFSKQSGFEVGHHCFVPKDHPILSDKKSRLTIDDLSRYRCAITGDFAPKWLDGVPLAPSIPFDRTAIETFCRDGGIIVCCDSYDQSFPKLIRMPLNAPPMGVGFFFRPDSGRIVHAFVNPR